MHAVGGQLLVSVCPIGGSPNYPVFAKKKLYNNLLKRLIEKSLHVEPFKYMFLGTDNQMLRKFMS